MVYPPHMLFALPLVAVILVGSPGDCEYYTKGCGWVVCCLNGLARGFLFYLLFVVAGLVVAGVVVVRLGAGFVFVVGWVGE